ADLGRPAARVGGLGGVLALAAPPHAAPHGGRRGRAERRGHRGFLRKGVRLLFRIVCSQRQRKSNLTPFLICRAPSRAAPNSPSARCRSTCSTRPRRERRAAGPPTAAWSR